MIKDMNRFMKKVASEFVLRYSDPPTITYEETDFGRFDKCYYITTTYPNMFAGGESGTIKFGLVINELEYDEVIKRHRKIDDRDYGYDGSDGYIQLVVISNPEVLIYEVEEFTEIFTETWDTDQEYDYSGPKDTDPVATEVSVC